MQDARQSPRWAAPDTELVERAVLLADQLLRLATAGATRAEQRRQARLGRLIADADGRELVQRLTDEVLRMHQDQRAARHFRQLVRTHGVPASLGRIDALLLRAGAALAVPLPWLVMPLVRRRILAETRGFIVDAEDPALAEHIRRRAAQGDRLNINVLGEAILSDHEADVRVRRVLAVMRRPDVHYISVKISSLCAKLDVLAFERSLERILEPLRLIYREALAQQPTVFVNLDMEEYGDLQLTVAAFMQLLDEPELRSLRAGIVLQAYLPDSHDALERIGDWAARRVQAGGAPVKVRIVKGANLAMEQVEAELHGWVQAPYPTKADVDASYKRLLESALRAEWADALSLGVASHNLFDVAWALVLRDLLPAQERARIEIEMLEGMVPAEARVVRERAGELLLYCPIVRHDEIEASLAYLARRFDENTAPENYLRAMFTMLPGSPEFDRQAERFRAAVHARHSIATAPRRPAAAQRPVDSFSNEPDTDMTSAPTRLAIAEAMRTTTLPAVTLIETTAEIDAIVQGAVAAQRGWEALGARARMAVLDDVAARMSAERFGTLAVMAHEAGKTVREGDAEVSEAIDFARYYGRTVHEAGTTACGVVLVAAPWNFPYAIPAGGVLASLAAGNAVVLKPAPETRATARWLVEQCWRAGVPRDVLQFVACRDDEIGVHLVTHTGFSTVVLTGAYATARLFLDWRPGMRLLAETSGKNSIVVTAAADVDAAINDIVRSAFGHAGQKCSAASLAILEAPLYDDPTFLARLAEAVRTVRVGAAEDPATVMGPLIAPPGGALRRALTSLEPGERWLVEPLCLSPDERLWSPGVRVGVAPGSWFHETECFGPVLGVMRASDLAEAIELQNATPFGLTGGIHSLDGAEVKQWLAGVQVGNAYVNRHITGAVVQRQPFGGWKRSSVGGAPKAGGPHYVSALRAVVPQPIDVAAATSSYRAAWAALSVPTDATGLRSERNVLRHLPLPRVVVRAGDDTPAGWIDAAEAAARIVGTPAAVVMRGDVADDVFAAQLAAEPPTRLRLLTAADDVLLRACHEHDISVDSVAVSAEGIVELPHWLHEQAVSATHHRYGRVLP